MAAKDFARSSIGAGAITGIFLICYFLVIRLLDLNYIMKFRFANIFFIGLAIAFVIRERKKRPEGLHYLSGSLSGLLTGTVASVILNFFLLVYLGVIDPGYTAYTVKEGLMGDFMSPMGIVIVSFLEESSATVIITLMAMLLFLRKA